MSHQNLQFYGCFSLSSDSQGVFSPRVATFCGVTTHGVIIVSVTALRWVLFSFIERQSIHACLYSRCVTFSSQNRQADLNWTEVNWIKLINPPKGQWGAGFTDHHQHHGTNNIKLTSVWGHTAHLPSLFIHFFILRRHSALI